MAGRFARGGRLLAFGDGLAAEDAAHVVVEFAHPVIVGKRALPAMRLTDPATLPLFAEPDDIALAISPGGDDPRVTAALRAAASPSRWSAPPGRPTGSTTSSRWRRTTRGSCARPT